MNKADLIVNDYYEQVDPSQLDDKYLRLYSDVETSYKAIFADLHQALNLHFDFMNTKSKTNQHFNADDSRSLIARIESIHEMTAALKNEGIEVVMNGDYMSQIDYVITFLSPSGGSSIPDNYKHFNLVKYDPIFEIANKTVKLPGINRAINLNMIGEGSYAIVQSYTDPHYEITFAIKQAKKTISDRDKYRFINEFKIMKRLRFPYLLEVYKFEEEKMRYTMEFCEYTLERYIRENNQKLSFDVRRKLAQQFLYALNYLHANGVMHRDISYGNVLIKMYGQVPAVRLSDFGLAKDSDSDFTKSDTSIKGTIRDPYLESMKDYNVINEMYVVGYVLNYIFTGKKSLNSGRNPVISIVSKCVSNVLNDRYMTISEVISDLEKVKI